MPEPSSTPTDTNVAVDQNGSVEESIAVRTEGVTVTFGAGVRALSDVYLTLKHGELVALIGANGSGKSTLLKALFGVLQPNAGSIEVLGLRPQGNSRALRAIVGYAPQDAALDPEITGWETLRLFHALRGLQARDRDTLLDTIADEYDLRGFCNRLAGTYSGGQRQRLHLALETMHAPQLLLLDEPTASLDPGARRALWGRLAARRDAGTTIVVATHDLADVSAVCDRVVLLDHGRVLASESPDAIVASQGGACTVITLTGPAGAAAEGLRDALLALENTIDVVMEETVITIWRTRHPDAGEPALDVLAARGLGCRRYERAEPDLAAAYFRITGTALSSPDREAPRGAGNGNGHAAREGRGGNGPGSGRGGGGGRQGNGSGRGGR